MDINRISPALAAGQYEVAVSRKILASQREEGQQALKLIEAASPPANAANGVGGRLNIVA